MELWLLEEKLWLGFFDRQSAAMADLLVAEVAGVRSRVLVLGFWASAFILCRVLFLSLCGCVYWAFGLRTFVRLCIVFH